jgi:hypothetical protein
VTRRNRSIPSLAILFVLAAAFLAPAAASAGPTLGTKLTDDANELQWLHINAVGGTFNLSFGGETSGDLAFNVPAGGGVGPTASVGNALNALDAIASAGSVTVSGGFEGEYYIAFSGGAFAGADVPLIEVKNGTNPLAPISGPPAAVQTIDPAGVNRGDESVIYTVSVTNTGSDPVSGETASVEFRAPAAQQGAVTAASGAGWSCEGFAPSGALPAHATCTRADNLPVGSSYPPIAFRVNPGADALEHAIATATATCAACSPAPPPATDEFTFLPANPFGIQASEGGLFGPSGGLPHGDPYTQAGGHPFEGAADFWFFLKRRAVGDPADLNGYAAVEQVKQIFADLPRGQVGNPLAVPHLCTDTTDALEHCPDDSVVGAVSVWVQNPGGAFRNVPIYALEPETGTPAQFAFLIGATIYTLSARVRPEANYAASLDLQPASLVGLRASKVALCDFGAKLFTGIVRGCKQAGDPTANPKPLFANPTACDPLAPPQVVTRLNSWEHPDVLAEDVITTPPLTGCDLVPFEPQMSLQPTSARADSPTGLDVDLQMPTDGLESKTGIAQANLRQAKVVLPQGMAVNPTAAQGLGACTAAQFGIDPDSGVPDGAEPSCPDSAKVGTVSIVTPILKHDLAGDVYVAKQGADNPFDSTLALYMVVSSPRDGINVKLAGEVKPDPLTGQLTVSFDRNPEQPFSSVSLHFPQGPRSPLLNPPRCGRYQIEAQLSPWNAADTVVQTSSFDVTEGPDGGPCPSGDLSAGFEAGTQSPLAGTTSPLVVRLRREDGSQRLKALNLNLPQGLSAYLKGVAQCPDAVLGAIPAAEGTAQAEVEQPSCSAASQVGTVGVGAGAGSSPLFVDTGKAYLAGPYRGAPLSLAVVTPALAGPFDLGNVVVRTALYVNPKTTEITAVSDPLPTILHGLLLDVRELRISIDRPHFTLNPTSCEATAIGAQVVGADGATQGLANRFQAQGCGGLAFAPGLKLQLHGGTGRAKYQRLEAIVTYPEGPGYANIARAAVTLPHSEFLAQEHIRTVCTRVQFAAKACPPGSVYGFAEAVTPLLDQPLVGPVYLRSSDNPLPDLVAALRGPDSQPIEVELAGRTDSVHGGIRNTFDLVPDAPVSKFRLQLFGGKKSLIVNSRDLCKGKKQRATVLMNAQNGMVRQFRPVVGNDCKKHRKHKHRKHHRPRRQA